jgi:tRNA 2-thiouridine synthesizing protein E
MKYIVNEASGDLEVQERLAELEAWDESAARRLAAEEGIDLSDSHWEVLECLRKFYVENGMPEHSLRLTQWLSEEFATKGGLKYLYSLFPNGPVRTGNKIAGLPVPKDSVDPSFGSVR